MSAPPAVTVVMTVYNGARYLEEAVCSILGQTLKDLELLIVDDASDDATPELLAGFAKADARVRVLTNEVNTGTCAATNRALGVARGRYIAIADADDASAPHRLQRQAAFLDDHPEVGIVSSRIRCMDPEGRPMPTQDGRPTEAATVHWTLMFRCCVAHGASMVRRSLHGQMRGYDPAYDYAFDYAFFLKASRVTQIVNLPEALLSVRIHSASVSHRFQARQFEYSLRAQQAALSAWLGRSVDQKTTQALTHLYKGTTPHAAYRAWKVLAELHRGFESRFKSDLERRPVRAHLARQRMYLVLKACRVPQIASRLLGGNFSRLPGLANLFRY